MDSRDAGLKSFICYYVELLCSGSHPPLLSEHSCDVRVTLTHDTDHSAVQTELDFFFFFCVHTVLKKTDLGHKRGKKSDSGH